MKIPNNSLPLIRGKYQHYGQYAILKPDILKDKTLTGIYPLKYVGAIASKELSQYIVDAANKFSEAIELLKTFKKDAQMALRNDWDRSDEGFEAQLNLINNFLEDIEDEKY